MAANNPFGIEDTKFVPNDIADDDFLNLFTGDDKKITPNAPAPQSSDNASKDNELEKKKKPEEKKTEQKIIDKKEEEEEEEETAEGDNEDEEEGEENDDQTDIFGVESSGSPTPGEPSSEGDEEENIFSIIAKDLFQGGILTKEEDEDPSQYKDASSLRERFEYEKRKGAANALREFLEQFGEEYREMFDAVFVKGVHPKDYIENFVNKQEITNLDLSIEYNQERVIEESMRSQGFDDEDIKSEIERLRRYGELENAARKHHKVLVKKYEEKAKQLEEEKQKELEAKKQFEEQYAAQVQKIIQEKLKEKNFDGYPITPKVANQVYDFLVNKKWKDNTGKTYTDFDLFVYNLDKPENFPLKVKLALLAVNNFDLSKVEKVLKSKESDELFTSLASRQIKTTSKPKTQTKPSGQSDADDLFSLALKFS